MSDSDERYPSPFDSFPSGPIEAHVAHDGRLRGYDVASDLARHYAFVESVYMMLTGEFPSENDARSVEAALYMLTDVSVGQAAVHAARVVRHVHSRGDEAAVVGTAGLALAEQARHLLRTHDGWLAWLASDRAGALPEAARRSPEDAREAARVDAFVQNLPAEHALA
ncbi:MAG TPA: hypothetical protein VLD39_15775, partial [Gammaproteobacteria bacterium]|nr:hypothetical protein [Gammaproteobacteria bacterium]